MTDAFKTLPRKKDVVGCGFTGRFSVDIKENYWYSLDGEHWDPDFRMFYSNSAGNNLSEICYSYPEKISEEEFIFPLGGTVTFTMDAEDRIFLNMASKGVGMKDVTFTPVTTP